jgi:hypothetical protein
MVRNRFDHLAKRIAQKMLEAFGKAVTQNEITPETQYADLYYEPDPARQEQRDRLGLLGRLAAHACIFEVYSDAPNGEDLRACLAKHLALWQQRVRDARAQSRKRGEPLDEESAASFLWIIAAGAPITLLQKLKLDPSPAWPPGIYLFGEDVLRVGIVVASQLPRDRSTLLLRLIAAGPLLGPAVLELARLPPDAYERVVAEPILLQFHGVLRQNPTHTPDEQEFIMAMMQSWEERKAEGQANALLTILGVRRIAVPEATREYILAQTDQKRLEEWIAKAVVASSLEDVIGGKR